MPMTTDASHDVGGVHEDSDEKGQADAPRPSLADWLVVSVRGSQAPGAPAAESVQSDVPAEALTGTITAASESIHEAHSEEEHEDDPTRTDFNVDDDADEVDSSRTLTPQIFLDEDLDEESSVPLPTPAERARRAALVRVAILVLGAAAALFFVGRWISRGGSSPPTARISVATAVAAPVPLPQPTADISTGDDTSVDNDEDQQTSEPSRSTAGGMESTGRVTRAPGPLVAPAWSVARFPDLPRDVLIACEQAALQAHSAAPTPEPPSPSEQ
jgi:hypothetical protein